ncbi:hypothetical protein FOCC_FOCC001855, partial [Frankliniella occidentalis]
MDGLADAVRQPGAQHLVPQEGRRPPDAALPGRLLCHQGRPQPPRVCRRKHADGEHGAVPAGELRRPRYIPPHRPVRGDCQLRGPPGRQGQVLQGHLCAHTLHRVPLLGRLYLLGP